MTDQQRGFDWGPPSESGGDSLREFGVYLLLAVLVIGGGWLLIDSAGGKEDPALFSPHDSVMSSTGSGSQTSGVASGAGIESGIRKIMVPANPPVALRPVEEIMPKRFFMIQLGAYGDEESARAAYQKLAGLGFKASVSLPDEQFELYRVLMGPFTSEPEAESLARKLNELEFPCFVIESL